MSPASFLSASGTSWNSGSNAAAIVTTVRYGITAAIADTRPPSRGRNHRASVTAAMAAITETSVIVR